MTADVTPLRKRRAERWADPAAIVNALQAAIAVLDAQGRFLFANSAAEQFFGRSSRRLNEHVLTDFLGADSPLLLLIDQARRSGSDVSEHGLELSGPRLGARVVSADVTPLGGKDGEVLLSLQEQTLARRIGDQLSRRTAARSITGMAMMLVHEVKNPLSGIRGAAQLLEPTVSDGDRELTQLIRDEADRIVSMVERMEVFSTGRPIDKGPVNIHEVLEHVRRVAQTGFGRDVRFVERYDPSLPPLWGNRDMLVQVFLNLVKNAAEAVPETGGEVVLRTAYQHGIRLALPNGGSRVHLPLVVTVADNGPGVPHDLRGSLFEPFVGTKAKGSGLGLALVAKIVNDHGGVVELEDDIGGAAFRVLLPVADRGGAGG